MEKLIRDKIPQIMQEKGEIADVYTADEAHYKSLLADKLLEECKEFTLASDHSSMIEELADVYEVLEAIIKHHGFKDIEIIEKKRSKRAARGGFDGRVVWRY